VEIGHVVEVPNVLEDLPAKMGDVIGSEKLGTRYAGLF